MLKKTALLLICLAFAACGLNQQNNANMQMTSLTNNMNLLGQDKEDGVSRKLTRITQETVDTNQNIHQKTVELTEEVQMNGAIGKAQSKTIYDSASGQKMGERSLTIQDNGSVSLSEFIQKFEASHAQDDKAFQTVAQGTTDNSVKTQDIAVQNTQNIETDKTATASVTQAKPAQKIEQATMQPISEEPTPKAPAKKAEKTSEILKKVQDERASSMLNVKTIASLYLPSHSASDVEIKEIALHAPQDLHSDL